MWDSKSDYLGEWPPFKQTEERRSYSSHNMAFSSTLSLQDPRSDRPILHWVKKIQPDRCSLPSYTSVKSCKKDMWFQVLRSSGICVIFMKSGCGTSESLLHFDKTKTIRLVLFYLLIFCLEGSVEVYVDTFPLCFALPTLTLWR